MPRVPRRCTTTPTTPASSPTPSTSPCAANRASWGAAGGRLVDARRSRMTHSPRPSFFNVPNRHTPTNPDLHPGSNDIVLAFSGGLDTSFCVPYLDERGYAVHTVFADTGGVDADERAFIEQRAAELGVASHRTVDGGPAIWDGFVKPFVWAGRGLPGPVPAAGLRPLPDRRGGHQARRRAGHERPSPTAAPAWATTRCVST